MAQIVLKQTHNIKLSMHVVCVTADPHLENLIRPSNVPINRL